MSLQSLVLIFILVLLTMFILKLSSKLFKFLTLALIGFFLFLSLNGCSKGNLDINSNMENVEDNTLLRIKDIPFIKQTSIDIERSLILGEGKSWSGQILLNIPEPKPAVFNFYAKNIDEFGWKEQTSIRGETSILNYVGENNRVIIISIRESRFNTSEVLISVAPYAEEFEEKVGEFINEKYLEITDWNKE